MTAREQRDGWYMIAKRRLAAGDKEGAIRARRIARWVARDYRRHDDD
jgi:hypothetical protein